MGDGERDDPLPDVEDGARKARGLAEPSGCGPGVRQLGQCQDPQIAECQEDPRTAITSRRCADRQRPVPTIRGTRRNLSAGRFRSTNPRRRPRQRSRPQGSRRRGKRRRTPSSPRSNRPAPTAVAEDRQGERGQQDADVPGRDQSREHADGRGQVPKAAASAISIVETGRRRRPAYPWTAPCDVLAGLGSTSALTWVATAPILDRPA